MTVQANVDERRKMEILHIKLEEAVKNSARPMIPKQPNKPWGNTAVSFDGTTADFHEQASELLELASAKLDKPREYPSDEVKAFLSH
jgi:hypothetical protein